MSTCIFQQTSAFILVPIMLIFNIQVRFSCFYTLYITYYHYTFSTISFAMLCFVKSKKYLYFSPPPFSNCNICDIIVLILIMEVL